MLKLIISGGQSGADLGGLLAAEALGIQTGGEAARGFRTENGRQIILRDRFGLHEGANYQYTERTMNNVINSDATIIFATDFESAGTKQTIDFCNRFNKPIFLYPIVGSHFEKSVREFVENIEVLNIAGNRESVSPGITVATRDALIRALK